MGPSQAIETGLKAIFPWRLFEVDEISRLTHGTTVATSPPIQRKGPAVALLAMEKIRDMQESGGLS
jgi:hypothetical protein